MIEVKLTIYRFDPRTDKQPFYKNYKVDADENSSVLDILTYIQQRVEPGLAFRSVCGKMKCGECGVMVNRCICLACWKKVEPHMTIQPLPSLPITRDLVVDRNRVIGNILKLAPSLLEPRGPTDVEYIETYIKLTTCMECLICQSVCPMFNNKKKQQQKEFIGPLGLLWLAQRGLDLKDHDKWGKEVRNALEICPDCGLCWKACVLQTDILKLAIEKLRSLSSIIRGEEKDTR